MYEHLYEHSEVIQVYVVMMLHHKSKNVFTVFLRI